MREKFIINGNKGELTVDETHMSWSLAGQDQRRQIHFCHIVGVKRSAKKVKIYYARQVNRLLMLKKLSIKLHDSSQSSDILSQLAQTAELAVDKRRKERPQRLLIFVNPYGGKGKALHLYKSQVKRLLVLAKIEHKLVVTKYANHARDTIEDQQFNLNNFDGIVCVGGDGMFSEIMNGLLFRYNRDKMAAQHQFNGSNQDNRDQESCHYNCDAANSNNDDKLDLVKRDKDNKSDKHKHDSSPSVQMLTKLKMALGGVGQQFISPTIPIGVVGAGSTDANSFGLLGTNDVITATLNIILGNQIKIDVCSIHSLNEDKVLRFVSTFAAYGYFGDVVRESEKLRWLGPTRYDVTGVNNLLKNRTYKGLVRILLSSQDGTPLDSERCHSSCKLCRFNDGTMRPIDELDLTVLEVRGPFVGVNAAVTACRCPQTAKGFSPDNHLANGCADLILVRPCTRLQYLRYLIRTGWTKKSAFELKYVEAYRCRQFEFVAGEPDPPPTAASCSSSSDEGRGSSVHSSASNVTFEQVSPGSSWNIDGEVLKDQSIRVKVNNQLLRVFGTGEMNSL